MARIVILFLFVSSCAFVGPKIASEEEKRARAILMMESQAWQKKQEQRILEIASRLIAAADNVEPLKFNFAGKIWDGWNRVDADAVNAWTDGESVWVTRGMMRFLKSDDELAVVLAHEMAHSYRGHIPFLRARQMFEAAVAAVTDIFAPGSGRAATILMEAASKKFDRDQEREADLFGLIWAHKAGYDIMGAKEIWRRMAIEIPESVEPGFLSSHPSSAERFLSIEKVTNTLKAGLDPLEVYATDGKRRQNPEKKLRIESLESRPPPPERFGNKSSNAVARAID